MRACSRLIAAARLFLRPLACMGYLQSACPLCTRASSHASMAHTATPPAASDFGAIQDSLVGFATVVTPVLANKLAQDRGGLQDAVKLVRASASFHHPPDVDQTRPAAALPLQLLTAAPPRRPASQAAPLQQLLAPASSGGATSLGGAAASDPSSGSTPQLRLPTRPGSGSSSGCLSPGRSPAGASPPSGGLLRSGSRRLMCTEGMLRALQAEIRKGDRGDDELAHCAGQLAVGCDMLGRGGYGEVYRRALRRACVPHMTLTASRPPHAKAHVPATCCHAPARLRSHAAARRRLCAQGHVAAPPRRGQGHEGAAERPRGCERGDGDGRAAGAQAPQRAGLHIYAQSAAARPPSQHHGVFAMASLRLRVCSACGALSNRLPYNPQIVTVFACLTDMVETSEGA